MVRWRWAVASSIGTSHIRLATRKQDAFKCHIVGPNAGIFYGIIADGAGSAPLGGEGASVVCRKLHSALKEHFSRTENFPSSEMLWSWIDEIRDSLGQSAEMREIRRQAFASTLVMVIASSEKTMVAHVGDGGIVARKASGEWEALSWPENGEYASTTYFVTDDPQPRLRIAETEQCYNAYALFTDGVEDLGLDQKAQIPHTPFFSNMISPLDKSTAEGKDGTLSLALAKFLESERVCERTDDDKTLILLSAA